MSAPDLFNFHLKFSRFWNLNRISLFGSGIIGFIIFLLSLNSISSLSGAGTWNWYFSLLLVLWGGVFQLLLYREAKNQITDGEGNNSREDYVDAFKEYIQVNGYLQTLIAFLITLACASQADTITIGSVTPAIALALITSIMGWYQGNELLNLYPEQVDVETELDRLARSFLQLRTSVNEYRQQFEQSGIIHLNSVKELTEGNREVLGKLNEARAQLLNNYQTFTSDLEASQGRFDKAVDGIMDIVKSSVTKNSERLKKQQQDMNERHEKFAAKLAENYQNIQNGFTDGTKEVIDKILVQQSELSNTMTKLTEVINRLDASFINTPGDEAE